MPPAICFRWKHRPKGLEFSACKVCNESASHADLVAGLVSRFYEPDGETVYVDEITEMFRAVSTNIPGLLQEMKMPRGAEKIALNKLPQKLEGGLVDASGPLLSSHMRVFALKMGLALHFETTGKALAKHEGIAVRWFSNYEKFTGQFPDEFVQLFPEPATLQNGSRHVSDQFQYSWRRAEDNSFCAFFASFRMSFAILAFTAKDPNILKRTENPISVYGPDDVENLIVNLVR